MWTECNVTWCASLPPLGPMPTASEPQWTHSHTCTTRAQQETWNRHTATQIIKSNKEHGTLHNIHICMYVNFGPFVVMLRSVWDHVGLFWDHVGIMLASIWDNFEVMLGSVWDQWEKSASRASYKRLVLRSVRRPLPPFASWSRQAFWKRRHSTIFHQKTQGFRKRNNVRPCGVWGELGRTGVGRAGVGCFGGDSLVPAMVAQ